MGDSANLWDAYIRYEVVAPATAGVIEATATIAGRNDPDHGNDTSTTRILVREPAAELYVPPGIGPGTSIWVRQETRPMPLNLVNTGQLAADDVALRLDVPPGWTTGVPTEPDPPGRACVGAPDGSSVTCTLEQVASGTIVTFFVPVTSPAGPSATGEATLTATTSTPEHGDLPNSTTETFWHVGDPQVAVSPSSGLADGGR